MPFLVEAAPVSRRPAQVKIDEPAMNACLDKLRQEAWTKKKNSRPDGGDTQGGVEKWNRPVSSRDLPKGCEQGSLENFKRALQIQIAYCRDKKETEPTKAQIGCREYSKKEWCLEVSRKMLKLAENSPDFATLIEKSKEEFDWVQNTGRVLDSEEGKFKKGDVQFTAYYSPAAFEARRSPSPEFPYPIYGRPADLVELSPEDPRSCGEDKITGKKFKICRLKPDGSLSLYPDRRDIMENKALAGKGLEIGYVADPIDIIDLQLQGSGSLKFPAPGGQSKTVQLEYVLNNGRTNHFLSRILRCMGAKPAEYGSFPAIRKFLAPYQNELSTILSFDQSVIFFREDEQGPYGWDHILLTPMHSFATDQSIIPTGAMIFFRTANPQADPGTCRETISLGIAQDKGGAIKGAHVDWFMGEGEEAHRRSNRINSPGSLFLALPKGAGKAVNNCPLGSVN